MLKFFVHCLCFDSTNPQSCKISKRFCCIDVTPSLNVWKRGLPKWLLLGGTNTATTDLKMWCLHALIMHCNTFQFFQVLSNHFGFPCASSIWISQTPEQQRCLLAAISESSVMWLVIGLFLLLSWACRHQEIFHSCNLAHRIPLYCCISSLTYLWIVCIHNALPSISENFCEFWYNVLRNTWWNHTISWQRSLGVLVLYICHHGIVSKMFRGAVGVPVASRTCDVSSPIGLNTLTLCSQKPLMALLPNLLHWMAGLGWRVFHLQGFLQVFPVILCLPDSY